MRGITGVDKNIFRVLSGTVLSGTDQNGASLRLLIQVERILVSPRDHRSRFQFKLGHLFVFAREPKRPQQSIDFGSFAKTGCKLMILNRVFGTDHGFCANKSKDIFFLLQHSYSQTRLSRLFGNILTGLQRD